MVGKLTKIGMPTTNMRAAVKWYEGREKKREATNGSGVVGEVGEKPTKGRPKAIKLPSKTGDSLLDALNNAIAVADGAFEEYELARVNKLPTRSARMSEHSKALEARLKTERAYREEMERRGLLVEKSFITEKVRRALEPGLRRLNKLASECGPQCNEHEPLKAVAILQRQVDEIKAAIHNALITL